VRGVPVDDDSDGQACEIFDYGGEADSIEDDVI
jgi:hypothetical protein